MAVQRKEGCRGRMKSKSDEFEFRRKVILRENFIVLLEGEHASESSPAEASLSYKGHRLLWESV